MAVLLSPIFNLPAFTDANGDPLAGGKIFQYEAGSFSVLKTTYTTQAGDVPNSNPIVLNSAGQLPAGVNIWLTEAELYNLVLTEADGTTVIKSFDNVSGVMTDTGVDPATQSVTVWVQTVGASYQSPTTFLVPGNNVTQYAPGNRVRITLSTGFLYGVVSASTYTTPNTVVTIIPDSGTLNSSLTKAEYSVLTATGPTVDAGGVSYIETLPYSTAGTVGNKIKAVEASTTAQVNALNTSLTNQINPIRNYYTATSPAQNYYAVTIPNYQNQSIFMISFPATSVNGYVYLNINGTGNRRILQMNYAGSYVDAVIKQYQASQVIWDSVNYILLDAIPTEPFFNYQIPHGLWGTGTPGSSAYFTVPENVYWLRVTVVGGGGGGQASTIIDSSSFPYSYLPGNPGGGAAMSYTVLNVSPGQVYNTTVGAGGAGGYSSPGMGPNGLAGGTSAFGGIYAAGGGANGVPGSYSGSNGNIVTPGGFGPSGFGPYGGNAYGSGGLGGVNGYAGGTGIAGLVMVEW